MGFKFKINTNKEQIFLKQLFKKKKKENFASTTENK